jgi:hypothetical protein
VRTSLARSILAYCGCGDGEEKGASALRLRAPLKVGASQTLKRVAFWVSSIFSCSRLSSFWKLL